MCPNPFEWEMSTPPTPQLGHGSLYFTNPLQHVEDAAQIKHILSSLVNNSKSLHVHA